ncbi:MAG TPA: ABC transporter permease [Candidatus Angelobacter sp.]|nr:ABC transporter permease [Candidatus Angelobacter sp.]
MERLFQDLRYGVRALLKNPGFSLIAIITLALGIGANTAVFSIVNALILRPYPFPDLDRITLLRAAGPKVTSEYRIAPADFLDLQREGEIFDELAAFQQGEASLTGAGDAESVVDCAVTPNFFQVLGTQPASGRLFASDEAERGRDQVVILNQGFWKRRFAADPEIVGKTIEVDGQKMTVAGIMPAAFNYPPATDFWRPLALTPELKAERNAQAVKGFAFQVIGRLRGNAPIGQAMSRLQAFAAGLQQRFPDTHQGRTFNLLRLREEQLNFTAPIFLPLQVAAMFVLLLAAANLVNLLFARLVGRQRELAVRSALGASGLRMALLFVGETVPLAGLAGMIALFCSAGTVRLIRDSIPVDYTKWIAGWSAIRVDWRVTGFAIVLTVAAGVAFAVGAAFHGKRANLTSALKEAGGRGSEGFTRRRLRSSLVVVQVVFATVLMIGAGLMVQGFYRLANVYRNFDPSNVLTMRINLPQQNYSDDARVRSFYQQFLANAAAMPGVQTAGLVTNPPASNVDSTKTLFVIEGRAVQRQSEAPSADLQSASADFFRTLHITLFEGRALTDQDGPDSQRIAVISRTMARRFWPAGSAVGQRIKLGAREAVAPWTTIVGVVDDVKQNWWDNQPHAAIYLSYLQAPRRASEFMVRTSADKQSIMTALRAAARSLDSRISFEGSTTMEQSVSDSLAPLRILGILMLIFGAAALALAALGIYGVLAHSVAQRTQEFGIRLALGAQRRDVLRLVIGQAWMLVLGGLAIGAPLSYLLSRLMGSLLYGVVAFNIVLFAGLAAMLVAVALCAGVVPARRATAVDPMLALRQE